MVVSVRLMEECAMANHSRDPNRVPSAPLPTCAGSRQASQALHILSETSARSQTDPCFHPHARVHAAAPICPGSEWGSEFR